MTRPTAPESETPHWVHVHSVDEMEAFYRAVLPQIRTEAKYHGYAIGLHGSLRRDLDLIAIPWSEDHSDKDELARAIQEAACGMPQINYQWEAKPCGRFSVSFPICWPEWHGMINAGHVDLAVMLDLATAYSLAQTEIKGHMRVEGELKATIAALQSNFRKDLSTGAYEESSAVAAPGPQTLARQWKIKALAAEGAVNKAQARIAAYDTVIQLLFERLPDCPVLGDLPGCVDELKARIAELEKAARRVVEASDRDAKKRLSQQVAVENFTDSRPEEIEYIEAHLALLEAIGQLDAALKDRA